MAKQAITYPLRVYDFKLWERFLNKAKKNGESINKELENAMRQYVPELPTKKPKQ